ncbi:MAG TPA: EAL domain-containing protein, partial [Rhodobacteraceae bacterium]|nr:EAL domain-containing protein [Paracoccaceae bacterium]
LLERYNIRLIAEKIESERSVVNVLDFDVALGQGYLFGKPRLVRGDIRRGADAFPLKMAS